MGHLVVITEVAVTVDVAKTVEAGMVVVVVCVTVVVEATNELVQAPPVQLVPVWPPRTRVVDGDEHGRD
jgi:hypothetical protein